MYFHILALQDQVSIQGPCRTIHTTMAEDGSPHQLLQQLPHQQNRSQKLQQQMPTMQLQGNLAICKRVLQLQAVCKNHSVTAASTVAMRMEHLGENGNNGRSHLMLLSLLVTWSLGIKKTGRPWFLLGRKQMTNWKASCSQYIR